MNKMSILTAATAAFLSAVSGSSAAQPAVQSATAPVLYDQTADDSYVGTVSQNYEADYDAYDSQAADDFTVPAGKTWKISSVMAAGAYFSGFGPAASVHITFYKQKLGKPGAVVADFPALACKDYFGSFTCKLPESVKLESGTYWLSVQANLDYSAGGQWVWENRTSVTGAAAVWQNPGDNFGTGCVKYRSESRCISNGLGDHMFQLMGKSI